LINNCTAICEAKENLQTLLKKTVAKHHLGVRFSNNPTTDYVRRYNFWKKLKLENAADILHIKMRARKLKQDNI
jgi:hypothetical protein